MPNNLWTIRFELEGLAEESRKELIRICQGIKRKDETFHFELRGSDYPCLIFRNSSRRQAFRRAMWIKERLAKHKLKAFFRIFKKRSDKPWSI